jgi:hypothetical protein
MVKYDALKRRGQRNNCGVTHLFFASEKQTVCLFQRFFEEDCIVKRSSSPRFVE